MSTLIEPLLGLLSDTGHRRRVILGGGGSFILALILFAAAPNFAVLLAATSLFYPASGAFVSVAQATWMDLEPTSTERNMGRWVLAGSIANVLGPVALLAAVALGSGWRAATLAAAIVSVPILISASRLSYPEPHPGSVDLRAALRGAIATIREREIIRWLTLLQLTDLLQDVFLGFVALYLVDVGQASPDPQRWESVSSPPRGSSAMPSCSPSCDGSTASGISAGRPRRRWSRTQLSSSPAPSRRS